MKTTTYLGSKNGLTVTVSDRPEPTKADMLRTNLILACTAYMYLHKQHRAVQGLIDECVNFVEKGYTLRTAVCMTFDGGLRNMLLARPSPQFGNSTVMTKDF